MIDLDAIGKRIAAYRKACGYTQEDLAERVNVTRQAVSKWENGASLPDTDCLVRLSDLFGTSIDEILIGGESERPRTQSIMEAEEVHRRSVKVDIGVVMGMAPLLEGPALDQLVASVDPTDVEFYHLISLGPFASGPALSALVAAMPPGRIGEGEANALRAFVDGQVLERYIRQAE